MHRWEYDPAQRRHECVPPEPGDVPSPDRCPGCGSQVDDEALEDFLQGQAPGTILSASLNFIANRGKVIFG